MTKDEEKIDEALTRGVVEILPSKDGLAKLLKKRKIKLYNGIDPTSPDIHIGNATQLLKLKQFQGLGHEVILLIGTFTAMVGDPSGHDKRRSPMTDAQIKKNIKTYKKQASKILDFSKVKIVYNGDWLSKKSFKDLIEISSKFTVQQIIERDLFQSRIKKNLPIGLNEFLYPLAQGYDSVQLNVDLEIGATDQTFNMLVGRTMQKIYNRKEKFVLTLPLIPGLDGRKMSKSYGNTVNITNTPNDMYGKIMSLKDDLVIQYFQVCTEVSIDEIDGYKDKIHKKPMGVKKKLAWEIVKLYHNKNNASQAQLEFENRFQKKAGALKPLEINVSDSIKVLEDVVVKSSEASKSEAKRLISQGSVDLNETVIKNPKHRVKIGDKIKIGKKTFIQIK